MRTLTLTALCGALAAPAWAAEPGLQFWAGGAVVHRNLDERAAGGGRLLTERGPMLQLHAGAQRSLAGGGALWAEAATLAGSLDYSGQTQAGVPLATTSRHRDARLAFGWRPVAPRAWGELWALAGWHYNRRAIASTQTATGLRESSTAGLLGARWRSPQFAGGARWQLRLEADAWVSLRHELEVDFGGVFDHVGFEGGRQRRFALRFVAAQPQSPWDWAVEWSRLSQPTSRTANLFRGGTLVGTVRQPRLYSEDLSLRLTRRF